MIFLIWILVGIFLVIGLAHFTSIFEDGDEFECGGLATLIIILWPLLLPMAIVCTLGYWLIYGGGLALQKISRGFFSAEESKRTRI